jgi:hypothetical protein
MPRKFICTLTTEELRHAYLDEHRTLNEMCEYIGVKNRITASKILNERGISTNANERKKQEVMRSMSDDDFSRMLSQRYADGHSMSEIANDLGITPSGVRKYFVKYGIERRGNTDFLQSCPEKNPNWHGGKRIKKSGYIEVYMPDHPNANKRKCIYEHQLVMEKHIGRYLRKGEVVHHIDQNKSNNDISNLLLMTNEEHAHLHALLKKGEQRKHTRR